MIHLRTLGALDLRLADGTELHSVLAQPKRLALLTYFAVATPRGYHRRDTLLGLFWPDLDQHRARNALSRAVYYLRRALSEQTIVGRGDEELKVPDEMIECDAREFEAALDSGNVEHALSLYHGDLLDGFFLSRAPQFERWLDDKRTALRRRAAAGAWGLARANEKNGDWSLAEQWARRSLVLSPYDEGGLGDLMRLLDRKGERGQALVLYDQVARRLSTDLGVEPSHQAKTLAESWRQEGSSPSIHHETARQPSRIDSAPVERPGLPGLRVRRTGRRRIALAVAVVAGCAWMFEPTSRGIRDTSPDPSFPVTTTIAVLPFSVREQTTAHGFLREGLVDLLSAKFNSAVGLRSVDPRALLAVPSLRTGTVVDPSTGRAVSERFGADHYLLGNVVVVGDRLHIAASVYVVRGEPMPVAKAAVTGESAEIFDLVDRLAADLMSEMGRPQERFARVASMTTQSPAALRAYLDGERMFRQTSFAPIVRFTEPIKAFRNATALDTTFALAHYRLAVAATWADSLELARRATSHALRYSVRLPMHYRLLIEGLDASLRGDGREAILNYRAAVTTHPDEAEAWSQLGSSTMIYGPWLGMSATDLRQAVAMAARYDGQGRNAWIVLSYLAVQDGDYRGADTLITRGYPDGVPVFWQALIALGLQDDARTQRALARLEQGQPFEQTVGAILVTRYLSDSRFGRRVGWRAVASSKGLDWHPEALRWVADIEWAGGRPRAAAGAFRDLAVLDPRLAAEFRALLAAWPLHPAPRAELEEARVMLGKSVDERPRFHLLPGTPSREVSEAIRLYLLGLLSACLGERDSAVKYARMLGATPSSPSLGSIAQDLALSLNAEVRAMVDSAPEEALIMLSSARYKIPIGALQAHAALFPVFARQRFLQGEWSRVIGRPQDALHWYASLGHVDHLADLPLLGPASLRAAGIYEEQGDVESARASYATFLNRWSDAEPELRPLVDSARARLLGLSR